MFIMLIIAVSDGYENFLKTVENVIRQNGINSGNENTMEKFKGNRETEKI